MQTTKETSRKPPPSSSSSSSSTPTTLQTLHTYRYHILAVTYSLLTVTAFLRVHRQPYNSRLKTEQYETIFKGTTLAAVLVGVGMTGGWGRARSEAVREGGGG
ncbi:hypothetical protein LTS18_005129 [Coniosporium uncinatum]|uniref:Uncharacterized protein n=1 Tax=Coniosporium uncinatum TaxID=93489 RepID=A0ACC3DRN9_9PEZI|nr:hypothetical protein LTS18_005129 [Coniosporium uncinatum]